MYIFGFQIRLRFLFLEFLFYSIYKCHGNESLKSLLGNYKVLFGACILVVLLYFVNKIYFVGVGFTVIAILLWKTNFKLIVNPFFAKIGRVSYCMYLLHFAVLAMMKKVLPSNVSLHQDVYAITCYCLLVGGAFIVALIAHRTIEQPFINSGKRIIQHLDTLVVRRASS